MLPRYVHGLVATAFTLGALHALNGSTPALAGPAQIPDAAYRDAGSPYVPGRAGRTLCVADFFCSPVVAQLGNPPGSAASQGITQATLTYPGRSFGPVFLAHVGTPEGSGFYSVKIGDPIAVVWADGGGSLYRVVSIHTYRLVGTDEMQDLSTGRTMTYLEAYTLNQSSPYLSLETCLRGPEKTARRGNLTLGASTWGRMFIKAEPLLDW